MPRRSASTRLRATKSASAGGTAAYWRMREQAACKRGASIISLVIVWSKYNERPRHVSDARVGTVQLGHSDAYETRTAGGSSASCQSVVPPAPSGFIARTQRPTRLRGLRHG